MSLLSPAPSSFSQNLIVADALMNLPPAGDPMWPVAAAEVGDAVSVMLSDPEYLVEVSDRIAAVLAAEGCDAIAGTSPAGDRIAGAVASTHTVRVFGAGVAAKRVLVVDGVLATGAALSMAIEEIERLGPEAPDVRAAVAVDLGEAGAAADHHSVIEI